MPDPENKIILRSLIQGKISPKVKVQQLIILEWAGECGSFVSVFMTWSSFNAFSCDLFRF